MCEFLYLRVDFLLPKIFFNMLMIIFQSIASPSWTCFLWFAGRRPPFSSMPKRQRPWLVHDDDDDDDDGSDDDDDNHIYCQ